MWLKDIFLWIVVENVAAWCKSINNTVSAAGEADSKIIPKRFQNTSKHRCQGYENNCHLGTFSGLSLAVNALILDVRK